ncbi:uncharacterized protein LOC132945383 isoform X2 [Metopolophium dirhodum]|uniref:uncharacterized protein LOC132945383 isoform X2 n=1 Tax=Metopolophium dirhodum TaxID=44670 RepID=UPI00298F9B62|nr:uncharacterized protein LOC132945383 isoform X2 [Metopolophium dirhodum]
MIIYPFIGPITDDQVDIFRVLEKVMCLATVDEESAELYRAVSENKIGMVTQMITNKGLEKASRQLHMSPLRAADMNPTTDDDDDADVTATAAEEQKQHCLPRPYPRAPAYMAPEVDYTGTGERPVEMSQAEENLPVFGNVDSPSTNYDGQEFGNYPRSSKSVSERPRGRRAPTYVAPEVDNTGTGERPVEMSQAKEDLPVFENVESPSMIYGGQEFGLFGDYPRSSKSVSERPRVRRVKSQKKRLED